MGTNSNATGDELRTALKAFVDYALTKEVVRVVRGIDVIEWMRNPVGPDGKVAISTEHKLSTDTFGIQIAGASRLLSNLPEGSSRLQLISLRGQVVSSVNLSNNSKRVALPDGITAGCTRLEWKVFRGH